jgi:hypothetical protein
MKRTKLTTYLTGFLCGASIALLALVPIYHMDVITPDPLNLNVDKKEESKRDKKNRKRKR